MSITTLNRQLTENREQAANVRAQFTQRHNAIANSPEYTDEHKKTEQATLAAGVTKQLNDLAKREEDLIEHERKTLRQQITGTAGTLGSDMISFRDAQDRADRIDNPTQLDAAMRRALDVDDNVLAHALLDRALATGNTAAATRFTNSHPAAADAVRDLTHLHNFQGNFHEQMTTFAAYKLPTT